ncbi:MAG: hypothetical protein ACRCYU_13040, partial [Nocardioides sp.]
MAETPVVADGRPEDPGSTVIVELLPDWVLDRDGRRLQAMPWSARHIDPRPASDLGLACVDNLTDPPQRHGSARIAVAEGHIRHERDVFNTDVGQAPHQFGQLSYVVLANKSLGHGCHARRDRR